MDRAVARENAFRTIYSKLFNEEFDGLEASDDLTKKYDTDFYNELVEKFVGHKEEIYAKILDNLTVKIDRVFKVDLALLYLAITELDYCETPKKVVVNEVVEYAKKYSTENSFKFINGFLAGLIK